MKNHIIFVSFISIFLLLTAGLAILAWLNWDKSRIVVEWETASEMDTAGFNIYRGESPDSISMLVNPELIAPSSDPLRGGKYQYIDSSVLPGKKYYYMVEEIDSSGQGQSYGPIQVQARSEGALEGLAAGVVLVIGLIGLSGWWIGSKRWGLKL